MDELVEICQSLEQAIAELRQNSESDALQSKVCLATRLAFTHFHALSVIGSLEIDAWATGLLRVLLLSAVTALPAGKYRDSVECRREDFEDFCKQQTAWDDADSAVPQR